MANPRKSPNSHLSKAGNMPVIQSNNCQPNEDTFRESAEKYQAIFENGLVAILFTSPDGSVQAANPAACRMFGMSEQELKDGGRDAVVDKSDPRLTPALEERARTGKFQGVLRLKRKDGTIFEADISNSLFKDSVGQTRVCQIIRDITEPMKLKDELVKAKEELEIKVKERTTELSESEDKYRSVVENAGELIVVVQNGRIKFINTRVADLTGYSREEILNRPFEFFIHPDELGIVNEIYAQRIQGERDQRQNESRIRHKDGNIRWVQIHSVSINWEGQPAVLALLSDITDLKKANQALKESRDKYQDLIETTGDFIWEIDSQGRFTYCSPQIKILWDLDPGKMLGQTPFDLIPSETREKAIQNFNELVASARPFKGLEMVSYDGQGNLSYLEVNGVPFFDKEGKISGYRGITRDITERKKAEQDLSIAYERLKQYGHRITQVQEEERKRIAYELHDDAAQYLALLKMQLGALIDSGKIESLEIMEKLKFLEKDASRAFNEVRRYSHELRPVILEHEGLIAALQQFSEDLNKLNNLRVEVKVDGDEQSLSEDVSLSFFRIAQEALNNTLKHARATKAIVNLSFQGKLLSMTITDNGNGFDMKQVTARSGQRGSLGLFSMRERADLIGATLKIESKPGYGTTISVFKEL